MDRLNLVNIKQEFDDDQQQQQQDNEVPETSIDNKSPKDFIKLEVEDEQKEFPINAQQQPKRKCSRVKKEEEGGEMKLEWDGDECDCDECRVERNVKIEFNKSIETARLCKRVKKEEEDDDGEWDEDCFCDDCNRNREKAMRLVQSNRTERQQTNCLDLANGENGAQYHGDGDGGAVAENGDSDGVKTEADEEVGHNERDQLVVVCAETPANVQVNGDILNNVELMEGEQSGDGDGEGDGESQINDESDYEQTEIDDEEYEMDVDDRESSDDDEAEEGDQSIPEPENHLSRNNKYRTGKLINKSPSLSRLTIYSRTNTGAQPFKCTWERCTKEFVFKGSMLRHYITHTGERPFECPWDNCSMKFNQKVTMQAHYRTHVGERPFKCSWNSCNKEFARKYNMKRHYMIHTGDRPFKCLWERCTKEFLSKQSMQSHYNTHRTRPEDAYL